MTITLFGLRVLFLLLLYGFLGMVALMVWRSLRQGAVQGQSSSARGQRLTVISAGDSGYAEGQQLPLRPVTTLGRDLSNDIVVADAYASSRHARVERRDDGRYWLVDVGSSNGTLLNGQRMPANTPLPLDPGDVLAIGKVEFKMG